MVTDHALEQLRERAAESVKHMTDRALSGRLDGAVEANFAKSTSIKFKGRECWLVELGHSFAVPLYAAVVDAEKKSRYRQVITTVLTRGAGQVVEWLSINNVTTADTVDVSTISNPQKKEKCIAWVLMWPNITITR